MAPGGNAGGSQQQGGGKKAINKGTGQAATTKRKTADESAQKRIGCPVLLESGCRIGESVDPANPGDAVKIVCQNPKCEYSPFIHRRCYDEWEDLLVTVMASTSWSRSWTDAQRRSNLWDKKGYQLIGKMCRCLCDKGHVRRDLDYKPPVKEDAAKKKLKKNQNTKNLPALKNPDFKSGFIGKQLPNANATSVVKIASTSATTSAPSTQTLTRSAATKRNFYQPPSASLQSPYQDPSQSYQRPSCNTSPMPSMQQQSGIDDGNQDGGDDSFSKQRGSFTFFNRSSAMQRLENASGGSMDVDCADGDELVDAALEFERNIVPCVQSLLRWKNTPIPLTDATLTEIVKNSSPETRKMICDAGGLGPALAKTGCFIVGADLVRLKENGTRFADQLPAAIRNAIRSSEETLKNEADHEVAVQPTIDQSSNKRGGPSNFECRRPNPYFDDARYNGQEWYASGGVGIDGNQYAIATPASFVSSDLPLNPACDRESTDVRSPSSGFESIVSLQSAHEIQLSESEIMAPRYFVPQRMLPSRESIDSGNWEIEKQRDWISRSLQRYGSIPTGQFMPHQPAFNARFIRPYWQPSPVPVPQSYFREYQLFNGPNFEDLFRQALPHVYNGAGRRFEPTNVFNDGFFSVDRTISILSQKWL